MTTLALSAFQIAGNAVVQTATSLALSTATGAIGRAFDTRNFEGPRLDSFHLQTSRDGASMSRVYGRVRLAGQVIWASNLREIVTEEEVERGGGKGGGPTQTNYSYRISFAIGICEGEILGVDQIWANGAPLQTAGISMRVHHGTEAQSPDPVIQAVEGPDVPAFRGTAYIVFEDFPLDDYGARLPQINVEVIRVPPAAQDGPRLEQQIRSVNLLPGTGEFALGTTIIEETFEPGQSRPINMNNLSGKADITQALDQLADQLPNCQNVSIIAAWFGSSLDCANCDIRPGVERRERRTSPQSWSVAGQTRNTAYIISDDIEGRPNYGGTPSDASLIEAIRAIRARGWSVTLYPFLLLDAPGFPWRGRITASQDKGAQVIGEVNAFFDGSAGFDAYIMHYANLAAQAGGVDRFIIGSEMKGLTRLRDAQNNFPAVARLKSLAQSVKAKLPQTDLSYAADWSEYFGFHPEDGSGDVFYHLDPLWADPAIAAIGIDAYFPLSDWRDGTYHLDASEANSPYDPTYLTSQIEGGEGYDYYYTSDTARETQTRTPISDGSGKPWVYRYKDVRNWWSNSHFDRRNGAELSTASPWVPESKPVWLLEIGCPAVNKGANQPNVFYDTKSVDAALPYFSDGSRDDLIQRSYLSALIAYWSGPNNPVSSAYQGAMIDPDMMSVWAWDARPFPDFPARDAVWSDGQNWERGHWLTGRMGLVSLSSVITDLAHQSGLDSVDTSQVTGLLQGYHVDRPMSARAALGPLLNIYDITLSERGGVVHFASPGTQAKIELREDDLVDAEISPVEVSRSDPNETLRDVRLHFIDIGYDYQLGTASARDLSALTVRVEDIRAPIVMDTSFATLTASRLLQSRQAAQMTLSCALGPHDALRAEVGDLVSLQDYPGSWQIEALDTPIDAARGTSLSARKISDMRVPALSGAGPRTTHRPVWTSEPVAFAFDLPGREPGLTVGARMQPFRAVEVSLGDQLARIDQPLRIGVLMSDLPSGPVGIWDRASHVTILIPELMAASKSEEVVLAGGNRMAIETARGWEILSAAQMVLSGAGQYECANLLRGLDGTDADMTDLIPAGARVIWLGSGVVRLDPGDELIGEALSLAVQSQGRQGVPAEITYQARALRPYAPVHLRLHEGTLSWIRRTRIGGDQWAGEVPLGEAEERYRVELLSGEDIVHSLEVSTSYTSLPDIDFDSARIAQLSSIYGAGAWAEIRRT